MQIGNELGNELGNESCRLLAESLKDNFTLQELDITGLRFFFFKMFFKLRKLENNITTVGIQYLYEALDKNKTLCSLNLRGKILEDFYFRLNSIIKRKN